MRFQIAVAVLQTLEVNSREEAQGKGKQQGVKQSSSISQQWKDVSARS